MRLLWVLCALLVTSPAWGATYYVSLSGSDANSCATATTTTQANNKLTIAAGVACASAGDTVYIRGGTYTGANATIDSQGHTVNTGTSYVNAVTISGYPGETAILQPSYNVSGVRLYNTATSYVIIQDLTIDLVNSTIGTDADGVQFGGDVTQPDHIRVQRCDVKNGAMFGIHSGSNVNFLEILNNKVHGFGSAASPGTDGHGLYMAGNDGLYEGNEVYLNANEGIQVFNNAVFSPGHTDPNRNVIRNNRVHDNGIAYPSTNAEGIVVSWGDANLVYNNLVYNNRDGGIKIYTGAINTIVANNTVYGNANHAITMQFYGAGNIVRNNLVYNNGVQPSPDGVTDYSGSGYTSDHNFLTDPSFTNAVGADFTLQAGSAAINAGTTIGSFSIDILGVSRPQGGTWDIGAYEVTSATVTITTLVLADGQRTAGYSQQACATGGTTPYAWTVDSGTVPAGTSLGTLTSTCATLSGTPTTATSYSFTLRVTDALSATTTKAYTVVIIDVTTTCSGGQGAWALIADTCISAGSSNGSASAVTAAVVTTGADLGLCAVADDKTTTQTPVTDSKSNTWTLLTSTTSEYGRVAIYYSRYTSVGSGHTFTAAPVGGATSYPVIQCMSWSGSKSSPLDLAATAGAVTAGSEVSAGQLAWGKTSELVVSAAGLEDANSVQSSSYTVYQRSYSVGKSFGVALGWKIYQRPTSTPEVATWTWSGTMSATAIAGMFFNQESVYPPTRFRFVR